MTGSNSGKGEVVEVSQNQLDVMERLVEELLKPCPEESLVEDYMQKAGLEYNSDPIERINMVLQALHFEGEQ